ncbi:MAG: VOC family protein [Actinomycetota bacterium]
MTSTFDLVTITTHDTEALSGFYAAALGLVEVEREDGDRWIVLAEVDGRRRIGFQRGEDRPGSIHLDLRCPAEELADEVSRLVSLGARLSCPVRIEPYGQVANLVDPAGNELDLVAYA